MPVTTDCLNEEQRAAALDTEGAVLITAGAGSGKTRLLTHRIAHIIEDLGIPAYNVLDTSSACSDHRVWIKLYDIFSG